MSKFNANYVEGLRENDKVFFPRGMRLEGTLVAVSPTQNFGDKAKIMPTSGTIGVATPVSRLRFGDTHTRDLPKSLDIFPWIVQATRDITSSHSHPPKAHSEANERTTPPPHYSAQSPDRSDVRPDALAASQLPTSDFIVDRSDWPAAVLARPRSIAMYRESRAAVNGTRTRRLRALESPCVFFRSFLGSTVEKSPKTSLARSFLRLRTTRTLRMYYVLYDYESKIINSEFC